MENTLNQNTNVSNLITDDVGFGIPTCECGKCMEALLGDEEETVVTQEMLNVWLQGVCPGNKAA